MERLDATAIQEGSNMLMPSGWKMKKMRCGNTALLSMKGMKAEFSMKQTNSFKSCLVRQVNEAVRIVAMFHSECTSGFRFLGFLLDFFK